MKLLSIGDNVCDVYLHLETMYPGGQSLNVAVYANMLNQASGYIGIFGKDDISDHILSVLDEMQVDYSHSRHYEGENGYAMVTLIYSDRVFLGSNKGGVAAQIPLTIRDEDVDYIRQFSVIHTSNNSFIDDILPDLKAIGVPISYDFSRRWQADPAWMQKVAPYCDIAFLSLPDDAKDEEIQPYIQRFHDAGCPMVIATFGKKGSFFSNGQKIYNQKPHLVEAIDTLGAGDSFAAAFLVNYYNAMEAKPSEMIPGSDYYEASILETLEAAAEFSSSTCLVRGAFDHGKKISRDDFVSRMQRPSFVRNVNSDD